MDEPSALVPSDPVFFVDATLFFGLDVNNPQEQMVFKMLESRLDERLNTLRTLRRVDPRLFRQEYLANKQKLEDLMSRIGSPLNIKQLPFADQERFFNVSIMVMCFRAVVAGIPIPVIRGQEAIDLLSGVPGSEDPGLVGGHWCKSPFLRRLYSLRNR